jgi:hypothetical protein
MGNNYPALKVLYYGIKDPLKQLYYDKFIFFSTYEIKMKEGDNNGEFIDIAYYSPNNDITIYLAYKQKTDNFFFHDKSNEEKLKVEYPDMMHYIFNIQLINNIFNINQIII